MRMLPAFQILQILANATQHSTVLTEDIQIYDQEFRQLENSFEIKLNELKTIVNNVLKSKYPNKYVN